MARPALAPEMIAPTDMGPAKRKQLGAPGLRAFLAIADLWGLSEKQRLAVLGQPSRSAFYAWVKKAQAGEAIALPLDTLLRVSAVLGIHKALTILFHDPVQAMVWLKGAHRGLPFSGQAPIELLESGTQDGLMSLRRYLDAWRGGGGQGVPPEGMEPVTRESLVFA
ncbi:MbcA/ParS/Xre antitoxin family protein [Seohaeicola nanhaiensis]|uniref:MbcA/ParS/Xre antitoxin family protein n=1 Tax=Seohaeicola nanhaiensis TaxID=1387282 RepID=A0ABV9KQQ2_9RHOB